MKKQFIHQNRKSRTRNSDAHKLDEIQSKLPFATVREKTIQNESFTNQARRNRVVDLVTTNTTPKLIIELDGKSHGGLGSIDESTATQKRNADFMRAGLPYIIVNEELADYLNLDKIKLMEYLIYHKLSEEMAIRNATNWTD